MVLVLSIGSFIGRFSCPVSYRVKKKKKKNQLFEAYKPCINVQRLNTKVVIVALDIYSQQVSLPFSMAMSPSPSQTGDRHETNFWTKVPNLSPSPSPSPLSIDDGWHGGQYPCQEYLTLIISQYSFSKNISDMPVDIQIHGLTVLMSRISNNI